MSLMGFDNFFSGACIFQLQTQIIKINPNNNSNKPRKSNLIEKLKMFGLKIHHFCEFEVAADRKEGERVRLAKENKKP